MTGADLLRGIPAVDQVLAAPEVARATRDLPRPAVVAAVRRILGEVRQSLVAGESTPAEPLTMSDLAPLVAEAARQSLEPVLGRVINATGIIIHTNLGRAPLGRAAVVAVEQVAQGYSNLEYDLTTGRRGGRTALIEDLLVDLTGAEAALAVNNNAAAIVLALTALASGREVVVSRGELIEIGGSFRIPEIIEAGGCLMREVGTTNKTRVADYEKAIGAKTAAVLKVHTSNYRVVGFTEAVSLDDLVALAREKNIAVIEDLGSGNLYDKTIGEPPVAVSVKAGADLITFSGDKLLGGPQSGLIVGKKDQVRSLRRHPLYRAMRLDKLTLAALEATLRVYKNGVPAEDIPILAALTGSPDSIKNRAEKLAAGLTGLREISAAVVETTAEVGGGALPGREITSRGVALSSTSFSADEIAATLRTGPLPVIGRVDGGAVILDLIAVGDTEIEDLTRAIIESFR